MKTVVVMERPNGSSIKPVQVVTRVERVATVQGIVNTLRGPPGRQGDKGEPGIAGSPGTGVGSSSRFNAPTPGVTWVINHNLGKPPQVSVFSTGGKQMWAEILHTSDMQTLISFDLPTAGYALYQA